MTDLVRKNDHAFTLYQVVELDHDTGTWYPHGGEYDHLGDAMNRLFEMQARYGDVGREFDVRYRAIGEWVSV